MSPSMRLIYFVLLALSLLSSWLGVHVLSQVPFGNVPGLAMLSAGLLVLAWVIVHPLKPLTDMDANSLQAKISRRFDPLVHSLLERPIIFAGLLAGALAVALARQPSLQPWPVLILWSGAIVIFLVGTAAPDTKLRIREGAPRLVQWVRASRWELLLVGMLAVLAFLGRGIALGAIPHSFHGDEGEMGLLGRAVLRGELRDPFGTAFLGHPSLWFFIQALALALFGDSIAGLRMVSAVIGALTIPALYGFARPLYGRTPAIVATALLAFYHVHLHYSRIGLNNVADPLMILVTLTALFYGYRRHSLVGFALAGVLMGLGQYFYYGTRLIVLIVCVLLVYLAIKERRQLQSFIGHFALLWTGFLITVGPLIRYYVANPVVYYSRMIEHGLIARGNIPDLQANGESLPLALLQHAYRSFGLYVTYGEHSPFYDSGLPLLSHGMELLFVVGLVLVLLNLRRAENFVLLVWVIGTAIFGGFLLWDPPMGQRYLIAAPALCILAALGLDQIAFWLSQTMSFSRGLRTGFTIVVVGALALWNLYFYFAVYTPLERYAITPVATDAGNYLQGKTGEVYAYMFTPPAFYLDYATIRFLANDPQGMNMNSPLTAITSLQEPPNRLRPVFIFIPERLTELDVVKQRYPDGQLHAYARPQDPEHPYMYVYEPR